VAGFQQDVTQTIAPPKIGIPNFNNNVSTVEDIADIVSVGADIWKMTQNAKANEALKAKNLQFDTAVNDYLKGAEDRKSQTGSFTSADRVRLNRIARGSFSSPTDQLEVLSRIAEATSTDLIKNTLGDNLSDTQKTLSSVRTRDPRALNIVMSSGKYGNDLNEVPDDLVGDLETDVIAMEVGFKNQDAAKVATDANPTFANFAKLSNHIFDNGMDAIGTQLPLILQQMKDRGIDSVESKQLVQQVRSQYVAFQEGQLRTVQALRRDLVSNNPDMDSKELKRIDDYIKLQTEEVKSNNKFIGEISDNLFKDTISIATELSNKMDIKTSKAFPVLKALASAFSGNSPTIDSMMKKILVETELGNVIQTGLEQSVLAGFGKEGRDLNIGGIASVAGGMKLNSVTKLFDGTSIDEEAIANRTDEMHSRWRWVATIVKDPELVNGFSEKEADRMGFGIIEMLKKAETGGNDEDLINASALLSSRAFGNYMSKLSKGSPKQAEGLSRFVASSTAMSVNREFRKDSSLSYDASTGEVSRTKEERTAVKDSSGEIVRDRNGNPTMETKEITRVDERLSLQLTQSAEILSQYSPFKDKEGNELTPTDAKEYLVNLVSPDQIKGSIKRYNKDETQAIKNGLTIKQIEEKLSSINQLKTINKNLSSGLEAQLKSRVDSVVNNPDVVDLTGESVDVQIEMLQKKLEELNANK